MMIQNQITIEENSDHDQSESESEQRQRNDTDSSEEFEAYRQRFKRNQEMKRKAGKDSLTLSLGGPGVQNHGSSGSGTIDGVQTTLSSDGFYERTADGYL